MLYLPMVMGPPWGGVNVIESCLSQAVQFGHELYLYPYESEGQSRKT